MRVCATRFSSYLLAALLWQLNAPPLWKDYKSRGSLYYIFLAHLLYSKPKSPQPTAWILARMQPVSKLLVVVKRFISSLENAFLILAIYPGRLGFVSFP